MKILLVAALFVASNGIASSSRAGEYGNLLPLGDVSKLELGSGALALQFPEGMIAKPLYRLHHARDKNHMTHGELPMNWGQLGWKLEGGLGIGSHTWFPGSHQVFSCIMRSRDTGEKSKMFSSTDPNCEGWFKQDFAYHIAFLNDVQVPGTVPLYRCYYKPNLDHYDTLTDNCEGVPGAVREAILGYVYL
ncbi:hypothetical protein ABQZ99_016965 [Xanthomonas hortorum pv. vitians]|uniref:Uncharacterized protein n=3 Tax=Xanthomonas hortorum TaxID=56454 RepID=A0AAW8ZTK2_9XANT|nr:hypothetical protein [Xanthomonas hortorum]MCC4624821.1 hypothetical protein [Xanthomonas campestris pv. nigromaculans]MCC8493283.1 hypothetical protein [Xanthomonas hortorum pv. gardneri]MCE4280412.1 hypothetical protein [Xanthomonas hortorum pv. vitians]MCE4284620.1 hypothetical protein [Xanthomonas hortorum pv. vitians]MCE4287668.1 hypothetical protein [Xanthomonas hortorum pv. vitians]